MILALGLGICLYFVYLLTFSGAFKSDDEQYIFDTTASFALRSGPDRFLLNQTVYLRGLQTTDVEPSQPLLAVPLYWIAYHIPWIGNVHTVFLFNPIITALTAIIIFYYSLSLNYDERTAILAAILFGVCTIVWPYTKTFFREPLTMLTLVASAFFINQWREAFNNNQRRKEVLWLLFGTLTLVIAALSKEVVLIALPILLVLGLPNWKTLVQRPRDILIIVLILIILGLSLRFALVFYKSQFEALANRYQPLIRLAGIIKGLPGSWYPALGYLFSPARGIFWYSPILILALGSPFILSRNRWRESILPLAMMFCFVIIYGAARQGVWHGGTGWGSRYMVPLVPFLIIGSLPLVDKILHSNKLLPKLLLAFLVASSLLIQFGGIYVNLIDYYDYQQKMIHLVPWNDVIIWSIRWSQAVGTLFYVPNAAPDIVWLMSHIYWTALSSIILSLIIAIVFILFISQNVALTKITIMVGGIGPLLAAGLTLFSLANIYSDSRFEGHNTDLHALRELVINQAGANDVIVLTTPHYVGHFMNYYKGQSIWYSLPLSPGERYSCEQIPEVLSGDLEEMVSPIAKGIWGRLAVRKSHIWLVADNGPLVPCATRPVERYFIERSYLVGEVNFTQLVRLLEFVLPSLPKDPDKPAIALAAKFGDSIRLIGFDLISSGDPEHPRPGDQVGISLLWQAEKKLDTDYTIAVYLIAPNGNIAIQQDRQPVGEFRPTTTWKPGNRLRDNYGFILPNSLPQGRYQLWVVIYSWPSLKRLPVTGLDGKSFGDHLVLNTIEIK